MRVFAALPVILALSACSAKTVSQSPPARGWHVEGGRLLDADGRERILYGFAIAMR